jgi:hypothetical protein
MRQSYRTRDQALAAYLIARGHEPEGWDLDPQGSVWFRFSHDAARDRRGYFERQPVDPKAYAAGWRKMSGWLDRALGT